MSDLNKENSYKTILKRISSFGGVQVFNILINLIRGKFVALLLGPEGMGISSLFVSSSNTIQQLSGLGLNLAIVKEVASEKEKGGNLNRIFSIALRLIFFTAIIGAILCVVLSPLLSKWSFGNYNYTLSFVFLASGVALSVAGAGYLSLLQGMGEVKRLAKSSIVGGLTGLLGGIPMYYFWGYRGIVPAIVLLSVTTFLFYYFSFKRSIPYEKLSFALKEHRPLIKKMISLGMILMLGSLAGTFTNYLINIIIRYYGSIDNIGLFQAANSITNQYVGIIFSALALDYFPRLSAISSDLEKMNKVVNRQCEIVILIMAPLVILVLLTTPLLIRLLLAETFIVVTPLVQWLALGVFLQGITFPLSYLYIANENKKIYFWLEIVLSNVLWLACSFIFYYYFSLIGLGISLVVRTGIDIFITYFICFRFYGFNFFIKTIKSILICMCLVVAGFIFTQFLPSVSILALSIILGLSLVYSSAILIAQWHKNN